MEMSRIVTLPVLFCLISIPTIGNAHAALTFGTSSVPYETLETEHFLSGMSQGTNAPLRTCQRN